MKTKQPILRPKLDEFIRVKMNMQKSEFAEFIGVSAPTVSKWLYTATEPNIHTLKCMARDFGLSKEEVEELFEVYE